METFLARVDKDGPVAKNNPELGRCWLWMGSRLPKGYGTFKVASKNVYAHRFAYEAFVGPIPDGRQLDHFACDRPECCNPQHVRPVTPRENVLRGRNQAADQLAQTHCLKGHPLDDSNTYRHQGHRQCRTCRTERQRAYRARRRAA